MGNYFDDRDGALAIELKLVEDEFSYRGMPSFGSSVLTLVGGG